MKLLQREAAERIGVDKTSVFNWEAKTSRTAGRFMPAVDRFLVVRAALHLAGLER